MRFEFQVDTNVEDFFNRKSYSLFSMNFENGVIKSCETLAGLKRRGGAWA